jgi:hypothetical protein
MGRFLINKYAITAANTNAMAEMTLPAMSNGIRNAVRRTARVDIENIYNLFLSVIAVLLPLK